MTNLEFIRLSASDASLGFTLFSMMAEIFDETFCGYSPAYLETLLRREDFWAIAAAEDGAPVGGLTAFTLPMTRSQLSELLIYDIAVLPTHQRRGIGRRLVQKVQTLAANRGIKTAWVPASNEDAHALDFYRALGGLPSAVTIFTFEHD
jgi:aminoglycoside 3-N-acetyltransferase I